MLNDQLHCTIRLCSITDLYYRRCEDLDRDSRSKPKPLKTKSIATTASSSNDDLTRPNSEYIKIELQCHDQITVKEAVQSQFHYHPLDLDLHLQADTAYDLVHFLIENPIHLYISEHDPNTNTCTRIALSHIDILEQIFHSEDVDQMFSYPVIYTSGLAPLTEISMEEQGQIMKKTEIGPAQCQIRIQQDCIDIIRDLDLHLLHLHLSQIRIRDPNGNLSDLPSIQYVQDQIQVQCQLGPVFPQPISLQSSASHVYSIGTGSNHEIRISPFYLHHQLSTEQYQHLRQYIASDDQPVIQFQLQIHGICHLIDSDQILTQDRQIQIYMDMKPFLHPLRELCQNHLQEIVHQDHIQCCVEIGISRHFHTDSVPSPLYILPSHQTETHLWNELKARAIDQIRSDLDLGKDLFQSGYEPSAILHSNLSERLSSDIQQLYRAYRLECKSDIDPDIIQCILHERIHQFIYDVDKHSTPGDIFDLDQLLMISQLYMKTDQYRQSLHILYYIHVQSHSTRYVDIGLDIGRCQLHLGQHAHVQILLGQWVHTDEKIWLMLTSAAIEYEQYARARKLLLSAAAPGTSNSNQYKILQVVYRLCVEHIKSDDIIDDANMQLNEEIINLVTHLLDWNLIRVSGIIVDQILSRDVSLYQSQEAVVQRIRSLIAMKKFAEARLLLPSLSDPLMRCELNGDINYEAGDLDSAYLFYRECYEMNTEHIRVLYRYADLSGSRSEIQTSIDVYLRMTRLYPLFTEAWYRLAIQYRSLGPAYLLHSQHCLGESIRYNPFHNHSWEHLQLHSS